MWKFVFSIYSIFSLCAESYQPGEYLKYKITWGYVDVGTSSLSVSQKESCNGIPCYRFISQAQSGGFLGSIYNVNDSIKSEFDITNERTITSAKKFHEGSYHREYTVEFDQKSQTANWWQRKLIGTLKISESNPEWRPKSGTTKSIPKHTLDILSAIYYTRSYGGPNQVGVYYEFSVYDDLELVPLRMNLMKKEMLELEINFKNYQIPTILAEPVISTSGMFRSGGKVWIWVTDDQFRVPIKMRAKIPVIGSVDIDLIDFKNIDLSMYEVL
jgi:hypothetical protein